MGLECVGARTWVGRLGLRARVRLRVRVRVGARVEARARARARARVRVRVRARLRARVMDRDRVRVRVRVSQVGSRTGQHAPQAVTHRGERDKDVGRLTGTRRAAAARALRMASR